MCPGCGKPMVVRRDGKYNRVYYHCSKHYRPWDKEACTYRRFIPGTWDDTAWDFVYALLSDDAWMEEQLEAERNRRDNAARLIEAEERKLVQIRGKIAKIQAPQPQTECQEDEICHEEHPFHGRIIAETQGTRRAMCRETGQIS